MKVKCKKERSQVDQLLAVSLREEELSSSLQAVDSSLIQARAALQAAYMEVQRLLVVKQQVTMEMSTLRSQRIEILQGMQDGYSGSAPPGEKNSSMDTAAAANPAPAPAPAAVPFHSAPPASLPRLSHPGPPHIKQEPTSPSQRSSPVENAHSAPYGTAPEPPLTSSLTEPAQPRSSMFQSLSEPRRASVSSLDSGSVSTESRLDRDQVQEEGQGAEQVSTSTPGRAGQAQPQEEEGEEEPRETPPPKPAAEQGGADSDDSSSLEMVELPQPGPLEVVAIDDSSDDETRPVAAETAEAPGPGRFEGGDPEPGLRRGQLHQRAGHHRQNQGLRQPNPATPDHCVLCAQTWPWRRATEGSTRLEHLLGGQLFTDRTVRAFHLASRKCVAVFEGHSSKVNCLLVSSGPGLQHRLYSGSSDKTIRCYSLKTQECVEQMSVPDRVLCLHSRWKVLYAGLANGNVVSFSLRSNRQLDVFECHGPRAVSCLVSAQEGARRLLLVGSYDCTISVRDAKNGLLLRTLEGHTKTVLCMKVVNDLVFSGSSDQSVQAHNIHTGELVRIYKGHSHAVTVVAILGKVMVTACLDKLVRVYELKSHDRLQVYGGHKDMVMCMAIHKSMIYTGCYDGSVQAVRLNLIQNYRCWWHGCSLIFGVREHLQQHVLSDHASPSFQTLNPTTGLQVYGGHKDMVMCMAIHKSMQHVLSDHASPSFQTLKCRWRNCDAFFTVRNNTHEDVPLHMQSHVEADSKLEP
ncbi:hypothetical protein ANANG_G00024350 [Anguilla anguilla]|uniref:C2H2-type domain-containing protein n=1 Tax=Anguilla anguilla TaxID=7936 RepID=A0A9D3N300_ANGAN|nr:hypothetical protein ANANG_G00024350 [Anguilla anguilla]